MSCKLHLLLVVFALQVLDEADTMFDRGFGPDIRKFIGPLKNRASKPDGLGFQTILVTATMTKVCMHHNLVGYMRSKY